MKEWTARELVRTILVPLLIVGAFLGCTTPIQITIRPFTLEVTNPDEVKKRHDAERAAEKAETKVREYDTY